MRNEDLKEYREMAQRFDLLKSLVGMPYKGEDGVERGDEFVNARKEVSSSCRRVVNEVPALLEWLQERGVTVEEDVESFLTTCRAAAEDEQRAIDDDMFGDPYDLSIRIRYAVAEEELAIVRRFLGLAPVPS